MNQQSATMYSLSAPRLRSRRLARIYFFPWMQLVCVTIIAALGWRIEISLFFLAVFWLTICFCCVIDDLSAPQSRLMRLLCWQKTRWKPSDPIPIHDPDYELHHFFSCTPPPFLKYRQHIRWWSSLLALLTIWSFAWLQATYNPADQITTKIVFTLSLYIIGLVPFAMFAVAPAPHLTIATNRRIMYTLAAIGNVICLLTFITFTPDARIILFVLALFNAIYTILFAIQRLWMGIKVLGEVIRDISMEFLSWPQASQKLTKVPKLLGSRLKFDRVFILQPTADERRLRVTAEFGDYHPVLNQEIPINQSLTGRAYQEQTSVIWNDVKACPYYHSMCPDNDTFAEIAIPIMYQGTVYAILDIQSKVKGAFSFGDLRAMETIAHILASAIAVDKREKFFRDAVRLWEDVLQNQHSFNTGQDVFDVFAQFAHKQLESDLVIYYPLTLTGYPLHIPFTSGTFHAPSLRRSPDGNPKSSLMQLLNNWQPYFEPNVNPDSLVARLSLPDDPSFVEREKIKATCFLPIGTHQERLGGLFLNFRGDKYFDDSFKFAVLSLAQSLAQAEAQVRYRDVVYRGFGRPEINIHSIIGRYGFKEGLKHQIENLQAEGQVTCCPSVETCHLQPVISQADKFINELRLADSANPPDFWKKTLKGQLEIFRSALPDAENGRRPRLKLNINVAIELEYPLVKLALFRIITEAISNAIFHGEASRITVTVQRQPHTIEAEIINNGHRLLKDAESRKSDNGIYNLLADCETHLGAATKISNLKNKTGVIVCVSLPGLPYSQEEK